MPKMSVNLYVIEDYENETTFRPQKNKPNSNPILSAVGGLQMNKKSLVGKSGHTPAYTVRQLFDIVVLYKYHLPIINPFTPFIRMTK